MGDGRDPLSVLEAECEAMAGELAALPDSAWVLPTRCEPWRVRDLVGHVTIGLAWLPGMLDEPAPPRAQVSARAYFRPDERFAPEATEARVQAAVGRFAGDRVGTEVEALRATVQATTDRCRAEPADRVVRTRHGDAMSLDDYLSTRVVEVALHGIDLADATGRDPWLTPAAADLVGELLVGADGVERIPLLGWGTTRFLRVATGRAAASEDDERRLRELGLDPLTLG